MKDFVLSTSLISELHSIVCGCPFGTAGSVEHYVETMNWLEAYPDPPSHP